MSVWDGTDGKGVFSPGLRLLYVEVEDAFIQLTVSAWTHTLIAVLQLMAWTCAALSASPFHGSLSECIVEVADWQYSDESVFVNCSLAHRPIAEQEAMPSARELREQLLLEGFL